jgi:hypothetical protein
MFLVADRQNDRWARQPVGVAAWSYPSAIVKNGEASEYAVTETATEGAA